MFVGQLLSCCMTAFNATQHIRDCRPILYSQRAQTVQVLCLHDNLDFVNCRLAGNCIGACLLGRDHVPVLSASAARMQTPCLLAIDSRLGRSPNP